MNSKKEINEAAISSPEAPNNLLLCVGQIQNFAQNVIKLMWKDTELWSSLSVSLSLWIITEGRMQRFSESEL